MGLIHQARLILSYVIPMKMGIHRGHCEQNATAILSKN